MTKNIGDVFPYPLKEKVDVGVIVGRFQVDELHEGHINLIEQIRNNHSKTIIFLGLSPCKCTTRNPLDFDSRKKMILDKFPEIIVLYIMDQYSDIAWSDNLDNQIKNIVGPRQKVILYGSRDSFIKYYSGKYPTEELEQTVFTSGTEIRKKISNMVAGSSDFRKGVIWATENRYPCCHPTVDIAIINKKNNKISLLLGKRRSEPKYRFIGGFVSPGETFEDAAFRETFEEASINLDSVQYLKSFTSEDWRYKNEIDKITTSFFIGSFSNGTPRPNDDIDELRWFFLDISLQSVIVEEHKAMLEHLLYHLKLR